jgi:glycosyltransferase involved in cell wall biosynthesis
MSVIAKSSEYSVPMIGASVSIIVPVYNTAPYVLATLRSLEAELPGSHEIIIVHDGGTDNSCAIACAWVAETKSRAIVIDQENAGLSVARKTGLSYARGKYVAFLDSDDIAALGIYSEMASFAEESGSDVTLCRSVVLDSISGRTDPFYDAWLWDQLLAGRAKRYTSLFESPELLRLEPNANCRVIRRDFWDKHGLAFEQGMLFEDLPVHVRSMCLPTRVGLLGRVGYFYRVNRAGKITDQKSSSRFDMIRSATIALAATKSWYGMNDIMGAHLTNMLVRMLYWCGANTFSGQRARYFREACLLFSNVPEAWILKHREVYATQECDRLLLVMFHLGDVNSLVRNSGGMRPSIPATIGLILKGRDPIAINFARRAMHKIVVHFQKFFFKAFVLRKFA